MDLNSPTTLGLAWILAPLLIALASAGLGAGLGRLSGLRPGALTLPAGFLAGVVLMTFLVRFGPSGVPTVIVCARAAVAGALVAWGRPLVRRPAIRRPALTAERLVPAVAGLAGYAIGMAPLAG